MNENVKKYGTLAVGAVACFAAGYLLRQPEVQVREIKGETKIEYKVDETAVKAAVEKWKEENKTYWKEVQYVKVPCPKCSPTMSCEDNTQIVYIEKSGGTEGKAEGSNQTAETSVTHTEGTVKEKVEVKYEQPQWMLTGHLGVAPLSLLDWSGPMVYGGQAQRRLWGPVWAGAWVHGGANWSGGLSVSMEW